MDKKCRNCHSLRKQILEQIEAFEILASINSQLSWTFLTRNLKDLLARDNGSEEDEVASPVESTEVMPNSENFPTVVDDGANDEGSIELTLNQNEIKADLPSPPKKIVDPLLPSIPSIPDNTDLQSVQENEKSSPQPPNETDWTESKVDTQETEIEASGSSTTLVFIEGDGNSSGPMEPTQGQCQTDTDPDPDPDMSRSIETSQLEKQSDLNSSLSLEKMRLSAGSIRKVYENGRELHECLICNKRLTQHHNALLHIRRIHHKELYNCPNCQEQFYNSKQSKHHNCPVDPVPVDSKQPLRDLPKQNCQKLLKPIKIKTRSKKIQNVKKLGRPKKTIQKNSKRIAKKFLKDLKNLVVRNPFENFDLKSTLNVKVILERLTLPPSFQPASQSLVDNSQFIEFGPPPLDDTSETNLDSKKKLKRKLKCDDGAGRRVSKRLLQRKIDEIVEPFTCLTIDDEVLIELENSSLTPSDLNESSQCETVSVSESSTKMMSLPERPPLIFTEDEKTMPALSLLNDPETTCHIISTGDDVPFDYILISGPGLTVEDPATIISQLTNSNHDHELDLNPELPIDLTSDKKATGSSQIEIESESEKKDNSIVDVDVNSKVIVQLEEPNCPIPIQLDSSLVLNPIPSDENSIIPIQPTTLDLGQEGQGQLDLTEQFSLASEIISQMMTSDSSQIDVEISRCEIETNPKVFIQVPQNFENNLNLNEKSLSPSITNDLGASIENSVLDSELPNLLCSNSKLKMDSTASLLNKSRKILREETPVVDLTSKKIIEH